MSFIVRVRFGRSISNKYINQYISMLISSTRQYYNTNSTTTHVSHITISCPPFQQHDQTQLQNVCKYVRKTREFAETIPGSHVTFVSNNAYENTPESLGECFERNAEGMLKNMAIHELALLVSFYDVSVENIDSVVADKDFSSMQTLPGPSGKEFTDFDKIKFTIKTKTGKEVSVAADRCGGTDSYATVTDTNGEEVFRYWMPDEEDKATVQTLQAKYPTAMPYFFTQDPDYVTVKERVAKFTATGEEAEGLATIGIAVETLRVAEYLTPLLMEQLK